MHNSVRLTIVAFLLSVVFVASNAMANCDKFDVVGNTQLSPTIELSADGQVTFGMPNWWEDDVYACYNAYVNPAYLFYFGGCDLDGSGLVEIAEVLEIYNFALQHPTGTVPAYAYQCPTYECPADMPAFYDVTTNDVDWIASGVCTELNGISGPPACSEAQHLGIATDINYILTNYPFTAAIIDGDSEQSYGIPQNAFLCSAPSGTTFTADTFAGINACYHGNDNFLFSGAMNTIEFDWSINVERAMADYLAVAQAELGAEAYCELDSIVMGTPVGFHASDAGYGFTSYNVIVKDECSHDGCKCDAELNIASDGAGSYVVETMNNYSYGCSDPAFNF